MNLLQYLERKEYLRHLVSRPIDVFSGLTGVVVVNFNPSLTKFDVSKYVIRSKKSRRSMGIDKRAKAILNYRMLGIAVSSKNMGINSSVLIRNVFSLFPVEMRIPLFSPMVQSFFSLGNRKRKLRKKNYVLRDKPAVLSNIPFSYVIR